MEASLIDGLYHLEAVHWWFCARREILLSVIDRYTENNTLDGKRLKVCELGCGTGLMLRHLETDRHAEVWGMDQSERAVALARRRGLANIRQGALPGQVPFAGSDFDVVLVLDILEHIEDDQTSLARAAELLRPNGVLVCTVPAYNFLWTAFDAVHGHRRRYCRGTLRPLFERAGLRLELFTYFNTLLFPVALLQRLWARAAGRDPTGAILAIPASPLNRLLYLLFRTEKHLILRFPLPFGLSLLGVARPEKRS